MEQKKSKEYWEQRARENENKVYNQGTELIKELGSSYLKARREIQKSINDLVARYMDKTELSYNEAIKNLTSSEFKEWKMSLEEYETEIRRLKKISPELANKLKIELETLAMKSRITRLDILKAQIDFELNKKGITEQKSIEDGIGTVYKEFYKMYTTDFGITGINTVLPKKTIERLMQQPWSGANFSERIWGNTEALGKVLKQEIIQAFVQGVSIKDLSDRIEKRFENDRYNTERLVRTELNYALNQSTKLSYEEAEIEEYEYLAEIDGRTSDICKELNGQKFKMKDAKVGVNYPPLHPQCRSSTIPVMNYEDIKTDKKVKEKETKKTVKEPIKSDIIKENSKINNEFKSFNNFQKWQGFIKDEEDKFLNSISEDEKELLQGYTGSLADSLNTSLREKNVPENYKKLVKIMRNTLDKFELKNDIVTYRAIDFSEVFEDVSDIKELVGKQYEDLGFMSTTPIFNTVKRYGNDFGKDTIFEIKIKAGKGKGAYIGKISFYKDGLEKEENEFLLKNGNKFLITEVSEKDGFSLIRMVELNE